jgi:hypothetical protein
VRQLKEQVQERAALQVWLDEEQLGNFAALHREVRCAWCVVACQSAPNTFLPSPSQMEEGIKHARAVVLCLSPIFMTRPNCLKELRWALQFHGAGRGTLVPLVLHPYLLRKPQNVWGSATDESLGGLAPGQRFGCDEVPTAEAVALLKRLTDHALYGDWTELEATTSEVDASGWAWGAAADAKVAQLVSTLSGASRPSAPVVEGAADGGATAGEASHGVSAQGNEASSEAALAASREREREREREQREHELAMAKQTAAAAAAAAAAEREHALELAKLDLERDRLKNKKSGACALL